MRRAARAVALENSRLRSLLASHGVTSDEVERHLASFGDQAVHESGGEPAMCHAPSQILPSHHRQALDTACAAIDAAVAVRQHRIDADSHSSGSPFPVEAPEAPMPGPHPSDNAPASALDMLAVLADARFQQACCGPITQCSPAHAQEVPSLAHGLKSPLYGSDSDLPAPTSPISGSEMPSSTASHLEMSCTAAAQIMASISYSNRNEESTRKALGCSGPEECFVKNTMLFQLLDSSEAI
jgi:hypothetical protein